LPKTYRIYNADSNEWLMSPRQDLDEAKRDVDLLCSTDGVSGLLEVRAFEEGEEPPLALGEIVYKRHA
jgi:hypothetical protein